MEIVCDSVEILGIVLNSSISKLIKPRNVLLWVHVKFTKHKYPTQISNWW